MVVHAKEPLLLRSPGVSLQAHQLQLSMNDGLPNRSTEVCDVCNVWGSAFAVPATLRQFGSFRPGQLLFHQLRRSTASV